VVERWAGNRMRGLCSNIGRGGLPLCECEVLTEILAAREKTSHHVPTGHKNEKATELLLPFRPPDDRQGQGTTK